jgi:restriction system protein
MRSKWPTSSELTQEVMSVLAKFGGSATVEQIDKEVEASLNLSDELIKTMRSENRSELQYRLAWVRTKAKQKGLVTRTSPGVWKITNKE